MTTESGHKRGGSTNVTDNLSKDSTKITGAYAASTITQFGEWIDAWTGEHGFLEGTTMVIDRQTGRFDLWLSEVFHDE